MDRVHSILFWAGLGCFALAFLLSGLYPYLITDARTPEATIAEVAAEVHDDFKALKDAYPVDFDRGFPEGRDALTLRQLTKIPENDPRRAASDAAWRRAHERALRDGRDIYVAEACWHCHSQFVRPVGKEAERFGPVSTAAQDNNALQRPVLWGTRRVGPDLTYEGGLRSNDWHVAHLRNPRATTPGSIMPAYSWYFRKGWQVRRGINPETAAREGLSEATSYAYPGLYDTKALAEAAMVRVAEEIPENLAEERDRLSVAEAEGPDGEALALIAYLQWLGTWRGKEKRHE